MSYREVYEKWCNDPYFDEASREELKALERNEAEIEDRFYRQLEFGTGGLRGVIGEGTNRINIYTVRQATQGLANYIISQNGQEKGVAIAHDSRRMSPEFAREAALCLNANGIKTYLFESLRPTPELSFAVRDYRKPQPERVQRIQSILGGRRTDYTAARQKHSRRGSKSNRVFCR